MFRITRLASTRATKYDFAAIESKWRATVIGQPKARANSLGEKFYALSMFPYPSGSLHMGHVRVYTISDCVARFKRMNGFNVIHPIGWDAFGLPAENAAIERGIPPAKWTQMNISQMKEQLNLLGLCFDWHREVTTCNPDYYKWTQWLFLQLHKHGLAYRSEAFVNWDPIDNTVLANEQVDSSGRSWRSGALVEQRTLRQWFFKITHFSKELHENLESLSWPRAVIDIQRAWIGRSHGTTVRFSLQGTSDSIAVFTTRPDTIFGVTFLALSASHPLVSQLSNQAGQESLKQFVQEILRADPSTKTEKKGMRLPLNVIHPVTKKSIPVFVADYVVDHGTGAVMGVPAHDVRDFEFAQMHGLDVIRVIQAPSSGGESSKLPYVESEGTLVNSGEQFNGQSVVDVLESMPRHLATLGVGEKTTITRLRDWLISRQRYWGAPIPIIHCKSCGAVPVPESELPVLLPELPEEAFTGRESSPLQQASEWIKTKCPKCGCDACRETDTMDTFVDSSWYYLRYLDPTNSDAICSPSKAKDLPVDVYIGGIEHAVLHLLYARFINHFLHQIGLTEQKEPFRKLLTQGLVHGQSLIHKDSGKLLKKNEVMTDSSGKLVQVGTNDEVVVQWAKMSKSKYNGVDPLEIMNKFGADAARLFILFKAPPELDLLWDSDSIQGVSRWLSRVYSLVNQYVEFEESHTVDSKEKLKKEASTIEIQVATQRAVQVFGNVINETYSFNVAVAELMKLSNVLKEAFPKLKNTPEYRDCLRSLIIMMSPMAPHISCELWSILNPGETSTVLEQPWPLLDESVFGKVESVEVAVQIGGKFRGSIKVASGSMTKEKDEYFMQAIHASDLSANILDASQVLKIIRANNGRLINIILKDN